MENCKWEKSGERTGQGALCRGCRVDIGKSDGLLIRGGHDVSVTVSESLLIPPKKCQVYSAVRLVFHLRLH